MMNKADTVESQTPGTSASIPYRLKGLRTFREKPPTLLVINGKTVVGNPFSGLSAKISHAHQFNFMEMKTLRQISPTVAREFGVSTDKSVSRMRTPVVLMKLQGLHHGNGGPFLGDPPAHSASIYSTHKNINLNTN